MQEAQRWRNKLGQQNLENNIKNITEDHAYIIFHSTQLDDKIFI